jgi:hypothetical protein
MSVTAGATGDEPLNFLRLALPLCRGGFPGRADRRGHGQIIVIRVSQPLTVLSESAVLSSREAAHSTLVGPNSTSTDPGTFLT